VLGIGTLWDNIGLVETDDAGDCMYTGVNARLEYDTILSGTGCTDPLPLELDGEPGDGNRCAQ